MNIEIFGMDLDKTVCSLAGLDATGAVVYRRRPQRHPLLNFLEHCEARAPLHERADR